jgi:hypothetical protein
MNEDAAVQKFTDEIVNYLGNLKEYETDDEKKRYFDEAFNAAIAKLTKDEVAAMLKFVIADNEIFFDIFASSAARSKRVGANSGT